MSRKELDKTIFISLFNLQINMLLWVLWENLIYLNGLNYVSALVIAECQQILLILFLMIFLNFLLVAYKRYQAVFWLSVLMLAFIFVEHFWHVSKVLFDFELQMPFYGIPAMFWWMLFSVPIIGMLMSKTKNFLDAFLLGVGQAVLIYAGTYFGMWFSGASEYILNELAFGLILTFFFGSPWVVSALLTAFACQRIFIDEDTATGSKPTSA